ncbi:FkbM family methyltransferase [Thermodesulfobacteriota bacterium]
MKIHHRLTQALGYEFINIRKHHPSLETHLKILFSHMDISLVLDIGANEGSFGRMIRDFGYKNRIISFEPVQTAYLQLARNIENDKRWQAFNYALGAEKKSLDMLVPCRNEFASFLEASDYGKENWSTVFTSTKREAVEVYRLDNVFPEMTETDINKEKIFLKIDTQGYDLEVMRGAGEVFRQIDAMQLELALIHIYKEMPDYLESLKMCRQLGFELTGIYPVSRNREKLSLVEVDCVFRKA